MPLLSPARAGIVKTAPRILRGGLLLLVLDLRKDSDEVSLRAGKDRDESAKRSRDRSDDLGDNALPPVLEGDGAARGVEVRALHPPPADAGAG